MAFVHLNVYTFARYHFTKLLIYQSTTPRSLPCLTKPVFC